MGAHNPFMFSVLVCFHVSMLFPLNLVLVLIKITLRKWKAKFKVPLFHCHGNILHLEILEHLELNVRHGMSNR